MYYAARQLTFTIAIAMIAGLAAPAARAEDPLPPQGLRTDFGDVLIENLGIGRTYNMRELAGRPLKLTNQGKETLSLILDVVIPSEKDMLTGRREAGFKPIPSVDWMKLSQSQFVVPSGESAYSDLILSIPNDPAYYGKKYQVSIYSRSTGNEFIHLGVWTHIFLTTIPSPAAQADMEKNKKRGFVGNMDYTLLPDKIVLEHAPIGRKIDFVKELKKSIKLANSGSDPIELRVRVIPVGDSPLSLQEGFQTPADLSWLKPKAETFTVPPDSFVDTGLTLELPNDPALHKKKLMFVLKVDPANPDIVGVTFYGKIYIEIE